MFSSSSLQKERGDTEEGSFFPFVKITDTGLVEGEILHEEEDDGDNESDMLMSPISNTYWIRQLLRRWQTLVNLRNVSWNLLNCCCPEVILVCNNHEKLNDYLKMYTLRTCPLKSDDIKYSELIKIAIYCRRIELRFTSETRHLTETRK